MKNIPPDLEALAQRFAEDATNIAAEGYARGYNEVLERQGVIPTAIAPAIADAVGVFRAAYRAAMLDAFRAGVRATL